MDKINVSMYMRLSNYEDDVKVSKIVAYVRSANKNEIGVCNQTEFIKNYLNSKEITLDDIYVDDGYSGVDNNRPAFKRLLDDVEKGLIDTIYVRNFSRFSRDLDNAIYYVNKYFPLHNVKIYSIDDERSKIETYDNLKHYKEAHSKKIKSGLASKRSQKEHSR